MTLADKYGRLRTDMEDMIEAHQENVRVWQFIKKFYEDQNSCPPTVCLDAIIKQKLDSIKSLKDALVRAKGWIETEPVEETLNEFDRETHAIVLDQINNAIQQATNP